MKIISFAFSIILSSFSVLASANPTSCLDFRPTGSAPVTLTGRIKRVQFQHPNPEIKPLTAILLILDTPICYLTPGEENGTVSSYQDNEIQIIDSKMNGKRLNNLKEGFVTTLRGDLSAMGVTAWYYSQTVLDLN